MLHDTVKEAQGKWFGILTALGIDQQFLRNKRGPCPLCGGKDRYRWDDKEGNGTFFCNQCGAGNGMKLLMLHSGMEFKEAAAKVDELLGVVERKEPPAESDPTPRLMQIGRGLRSSDGINPVRLYLRSRGLHSFPEDFIRYHPGLEYYDGRRRVGQFPAMVTRVSDVRGKGLTYHVTYLTQKGEKADVQHVKKIMRSRQNISGGAIRLSPVVQHLSLAEGVETALAVRQMFGVDCWATASATMLESFNVPDGVRRITIYADNDSSFTGQKAAYVLANRMYTRNREVAINVEMAPDVDSDFADLLKLRAEQRNHV